MFPLIHLCSQAWKGMESKEKLSLFFEVFSAVLVTTSIVFLIRQTDAQVDALKSGTFADIAGQQLELNRNFLNRPELRQYFAPNGQSIAPENPNYDAAIALADYHIDFFSLLWAQSSYFLESSNTQESDVAWNNYVGDMFSQSPILCERLNQIQSWYEPNFLDWIESLSTCQIQPRKS
jgi:hypothetical protein